MAASAEELLLSLGWPRPALAHTGTLSWTKAFGAGPAARLITASVVTTHGAIACRMRSARLAPPFQMAPHVETVWDIRAGRPYLQRWMADGQQRDVYMPAASDQALAHFKDTVASLAVQPQFQRGPPRQVDPAWASP